MKKIPYLLRQMMSMVWNHKLFIMAPILILLVFVSIFLYQLGPLAVITFLYAGV